MTEYFDYALVEKDEFILHPLKLTIIELIDAFRSTHEDKWPTDLYLTAADEVLICTLTAEDIGDKLYTDIITMGPRYLTQFFGLKIHWNSGTTSVR